jgi:hypothetical protein
LLLTLAVHLVLVLVHLVLVQQVLVSPGSPGSVVLALARLLRLLQQSLPSASLLLLLPAITPLAATKAVAQPV